MFVDTGKPIVKCKGNCVRGKTFPGTHAGGDVRDSKRGHAYLMENCQVPPECLNRRRQDTSTLVYGVISEYGNQCFRGSPEPYVCRISVCVDMHHRVPIVCLSENTHRYRPDDYDPLIGARKTFLQISNPGILVLDKILWGKIGFFRRKDGKPSSVPACPFAYKKDR